MSITSNYHDATKEQLEALPTAALMKIRAATYHRNVCSCGMDCGDAYIGEAEREYNQKQYASRTLVKEILATREHYPDKAERKANRQAKQLAKQNR